MQTNAVPALSRGRRRWVLAIVCTAMFMGVLDTTSVFSALPEITEALDFTSAGAQWVITAYGVSIGSLMLFGGRLADQHGARRVFVISVAIFAVASAACGIATSSEALIVGRVFQGVGAAVMTPAGLSILMNVFPEGPERNQAIGVWGGLGGLGASCGLVLGGLLTDWAGWSWIFFINVPVCLVVLVLALVKLPESSRRSGQLDIPGAVVATGSLVLVLLALFSVAERGPDLSALGFAAGATALAVAFFVIEKRSPDPLIPLRIFASKSLVRGNLVILAVGISVDGLIMIVTQYVQQVLGFSALQFGLTMAIMTVTSLVAVIFGQRLVTRFGARLVAATGLALVSVACLLLSRVSPAGSLVSDLLLGLLSFGVGMGLAFVAGQIAALVGVSEDDSGVAAGVEETSFSIGSTVGVALASAVAVGYATRQTSSPSPADLTDGYAVAFIALAGIAALGVVAALSLPRPNKGDNGHNGDNGES